MGDSVPAEEMEQMVTWICQKARMDLPVSGALLHFLLPKRVVHNGVLISGAMVTELEWLVMIGRMLLMYDTFLYSKRSRRMFEHSYLLSQGVQEDPDCVLVEDENDEEDSEYNDLLDNVETAASLDEDEDGDDVDDEE